MKQFDLASTPHHQATLQLPTFIAGLPRFARSKDGRMWVIASQTTASMFGIGMDQCFCDREQ
jgi:hypothetical protein